MRRLLAGLLVLARNFRPALSHPRITALGFTEGRGDLGITYDNDATSPRSIAYDVGRTLRRLDAGGE